MIETQEMPLSAQQTQCSHRTLEKRIGQTTYEVHIFFNEQSKETINDKICRLIRNQIADSQ